MNKTRKIYFLAAFVLIIGCYALNKSYSLFVDTQEKEAVSSSVPALVSDISVKNVVLQPYEEIILKETISNSSDVPVSYTLNSSSNYSSIVNLLNFEDNESFGLINPNEKREIYLYIKNETDSKNNINFSLDKNYSTVTNEVNSNINSKIDLKFSNNLYSNENTLGYKLFNQYILSDVNKVVDKEHIVKLMENKDSFILPLFDSESIKSIDVLDNVEDGMYKSEDDLGASYYLRGSVNNNYVSFADSLWQVIRINGDKSIRIIKEESIKTDSYSLASDDNTYIGYMYGNSNSTSYQDTHLNSNNSNIKNVLDMWYAKNIKDTYSLYVNNSIFCSNKNIKEDQTGYGKNNTDYEIDNVNDFKCNNIYSYYTNEDLLLNENKINTNLTYPIGLITRGEVLASGMLLGKTYLSSVFNYWTMTPATFKDNVAQVYIVNAENQLISSDVKVQNAIRPVISLKYDVLVSGGNGTKENPYVIDVSS